MLWTDWTQTEPNYFYARGVLYGVIAASVFWSIVVMWIVKGRVKR